MAIHDKIHWSFWVIGGLMQILVAAFLVWYFQQAQRKGWIRQS